MEARKMPGTIYLDAEPNQRQMEATSGSWENAALVNVGEGVRARCRPIFSAKKSHGLLADPSTDCFADHGLSFGPKD